MPSFDLAPDVCHVWRVDLAACAQQTASTSLLDAAERERAARFRFEQDGARFSACRNALRRILGNYLDCDPSEVVFSVAKQGRPYLRGIAKLEFNVSHSADLAVIAVSTRGPLGIDLESHHEVKSVLDLAFRYLHPDELRLVKSAPPAERSSVFLTCWTRKEAVLKSTGVGLTVDLRTLNVGAEPDETPLRLPGFPPLRVVSLTPSANFIAACATGPGVRRVELRRYEP